MCPGEDQRSHRSCNASQRRVSFAGISGDLTALGSAISLYLVTVFGCNTTAIMILFVITMTSNGAFLGGSAINHIDLANNFAGTLSGITFTITNFAGFFSPLVTSAIINERFTIQHVIIQTDDLTVIEGRADKIEVSDMCFHRRLFEVNDIR
uniref:Uncharacterized protein n=1 Tax=Timema tahoe TaxID=61484 RepID=A0A7R9IQY7_9NEOP|nr:unnamed protein product [Timema tahoe]